MKTLEEIKNEVAIEKAYYSWNEITFFNNRNVVFIELLMNEVAKRYAKEVAIASLEKDKKLIKIIELARDNAGFDYYNGIDWTYKKEEIIKLIK